MMSGGRPFYGMRLLLAGMLVAPVAAFASDFTPLFVLFVELPILGLSVLFLVISFTAPKAGLVLCIVLLIGSLFVIGWAADGYMESAGGLISLSLFVDIAGILLATKRINAPKAPESGDGA